ncbi:MAG: hypothetical protein HY699_23475 [Deltaproteobacteria bacterium]|nr:hypothetical protein [Deltaproteobacteria bacterium]
MLSALVIGCGGGGGGEGGGGAEVCADPEACTEVASGVAVSTVVSFTAALTDIPGTDLSGSAAALGRAGRRPLEIARELALAAVVPASGGAQAGGAAECGRCPLGGTVCASCSEGGGSSTVSGSFSSCRGEDDYGNTLLMNGNLSVTVGAAGVCRTGEVPDGVSMRMRLNGFSVVITDRYGDTIGRLTASFTASIEPHGYGCAGEDFTESLDGSFDIQSAEDDVNGALRFRALRLEVESAGFPCVRDIRANGGFDVNDRANGRRFSQDFREFHVTLADAGGEIVATLAGGVKIDCVGDVTLQTRSPIRLARGTACPHDGLLAVTRSEGTGLIHFTASGGVEFDYDGNGTVDAFAASCEDESVSQCR